MIINIIKETDKYILLWKEQGVPITPTKENKFCLISEFIKKRPDLKKVKGYKENEYGLLNRLDNDTAGIVVVAKTNLAFKELSCKMQNNQILKYYIALSNNKNKIKKGVIDYPIAHHKKKKKRMVIVKNNSDYRGKPQYSKTEFEIISNNKAKQLWNNMLDNKIPIPKILSKKNNTCLLCKITKGKRHQIRLHLAEIGYPIIGDKLYGKKDGIHTVKYHQLFSIGIEFLS